MKETTKRRYKRDPLVDPLRTKYWFQNIVVSSGISNPKTMNLRFRLGPPRIDAEGRDSYNPRFQRYMKGVCCPRRNLLERVNAACSGTLYDYEHVLWDLLREREHPICALKELQRLGPDIQRRVLYRGIELLDHVSGNSSNAPIKDNRQLPLESELDGIAFYTILLLDQYQETGTVPAWCQQLVYLSLLALAPYLEPRGLLDEFLQVFSERICSQLKIKEMSYFIDKDAFKRLYQAKQLIEVTAKKLPHATELPEQPKSASLTQNNLWVGSVFSFDTQLHVSVNKADSKDSDAYKIEATILSEARGYLSKLAHDIETVADSISEYRSPCLDVTIAGLVSQEVESAIPSDDTEPTQYDVQLAEHWSKYPQDAFFEWQSRRLMSNGKPYSRRSNRQFAAMWGRFLKFLAMSNSSVIETDHVVVERFLLSLSQTSRRAEAEVCDNRARDAETGTKYRYLILLEAIYSHLIEIGAYLYENPCAHASSYISRPPNQHAPAIMSTKQMDEFVRRVLACPETTWRQIRDRAMLLLIPGSGLAEGELLNLQMDQIVLDDDPSYIDIPAYGKTPARKAPILIFAREPLRRWLEVRKDFNLDTSIVFISGRSDGRSDGENTRRKLLPSSLYRKVRAIIEGQENEEPIFTVGGSGPQVLRNAFLVRQLDKSKPLKAVQYWAGHAKSRSTRRFEQLVVNPSGVEAD
ncbi:MAG TPA: tyrosine-type recombinase/integrase [Noviherbaspirillum sp.]|nr:tyrosine-type recombinase/integrase [Noviherbaspirillum sp.]